MSEKNLVGSLIVGQSGGPSSVINCSAYGVIKTGLENPNITKVYGAFHGIKGVLNDQLMIMDYNRVVKDLNDLTKEEFIGKIRESFQIEELQTGADGRPDKKGTFGMYLDGSWYRLTAKENILSKDPVKGLDVSVLQDYLLEPVLGIKDPKTDKRIDFVGGIRGMKELFSGTFLPHAM